MSSRPATRLRVEADVRHPDDTPLTEIEIDGAVTARVDARRPDLGLVDALARLQLEVSRRGGTMRLRDAPADLDGLLGLLGLAGVIGLQPRRQAELGEQLGIEEVMEPRDPPA